MYHCIIKAAVVKGKWDKWKLYRQALEVLESLGDLQGKAITWGMIGNTLFNVAHRHAKGIRYLLQGLLLLNQLGMEPHTQQAMAQDLADFRRRAGAEVFDPIWNELTHGAPLPAWLKGEEGEPGAGEG